MSDKNESFVCPESTIESANRRNFIRKAAIASTALAVGGSLGGKNLIPQSSASSDSYCGVFLKCNFISWGDVIIDLKNQNNGFLCSATKLLVHCAPCRGQSVCGPGHVLSFGVRCEKFVCGAYCGYQSGQAIGSAVTCGATNRFGLDFYTDYRKRISIKNCGNVGIGIICPTSALEVGGPAKLDSTLYVIGPTTLDSTLCVTYGMTAKSGVKGISCCCSGVFGLSTHATGVYGCSCCGTGIGGYSISGTGVYGESGGKIGVEGYVYNSGAIGLEGVTTNAESIPIVAKGAYDQTAPLQEWRNSTCTPLTLVSSCGAIGVGVTSPQRRICVTGKGHFS